MSNKKSSQKSLDRWTRQKWRTKSGKPSTQGPNATGERYLPSSAIVNMSSKEYAATTRKKVRTPRRVSNFLNNQGRLQARSEA